MLGLSSGNTPASPRLHATPASAASGRTAAARVSATVAGPTDPPGALDGPAVCTGQLHVYAISDLHTDYDANLDWVRSLRAPAGVVSAIIVAGDISHDITRIRATLKALTAAFDHVFFVPGNHELWIRGDPEHNGGARDSVAKLAAVLRMCRALGVHTTPQLLGRLWLVPLLSWHHQSFDKEPDIPNIPRASPLTISDYRACSWPPGVPGSAQHGAREVAAWFHALNRPHLARVPHRGRPPASAPGSSTGGGAAAAPSRSMVAGDGTVDAAVAGGIRASAPAGGGAAPAGGGAVPADDGPGAAVSQQEERGMPAAAAEAAAGAAGPSRLWQGQRKHQLQQEEYRDDAAAAAAGGGVRGEGSAAGREAAAAAAGSKDVEEALQVVAFSHFLPFQELLPEKRYLMFPNLAKAVGSDPLGACLLELRPDLHIFGHTHFAWDAPVHGIRCLQAPLCYPAERSYRPKSIHIASSWHHAPPATPHTPAHTAAPPTPSTPTAATQPPSPPPNTTAQSSPHSAFGTTAPNDRSRPSPRPSSPPRTSPPGSPSSAFGATSPRKHPLAAASGTPGAGQANDGGSALGWLPLLVHRASFRLERRAAAAAPGDGPERAEGQPGAGVSDSCVGAAGAPAGAGPAAGGDAAGAHGGGVDGEGAASDAARVDEAVEGGRSGWGSEAEVQLELRLCASVSAEALGGSRWARKHVAGGEEGGTAAGVVLQDAGAATAAGEGLGEAGGVSVPRGAGRGGHEACPAAESQDLEKGGWLSGDGVGEGGGTGLGSAGNGAGAGSEWVVVEWRGELTPRVRAAWSELYRVRPREASNVELAPYVAKRYKQRGRGTQQQNAAAGRGSRP